MRATWLFIAVLSTVIVGFHDGWTWMTLLWALEITVFGQFRIPNLARYVGWIKPDTGGKNCLAAMCACAVAIGAPIGVLMGVLLPLLYQLNISSHFGGLIGLFIGPCIAGYYGFTSALIVWALASLIAWIRRTHVTRHARMET